MSTLQQVRPVVRSFVSDRKIGGMGVQASDACSICKAACSFLPSWKKIACNLLCDATVC